MKEGLEAAGQQTREIYLVRHGQTDFNRQGIVQGRGVNSALNETGIEQSQRFYKAYKNTKFDHVYVSSLLRTRQTAQPFIDSGHPWTAHPELDEIDWGHSEGKRASPEMRKDYKRIIQGWSQGQLQVALPGGESPLDVKMRMEQFVEHWKTQSHQRSLVVSHGRAMRVLICVLLGRPLEHMEQFEHGNLSLYYLNYEQNRFNLLLRNTDLHLRVTS